MAHLIVGVAQVADDEPKQAREVAEEHYDYHQADCLKQLGYEYNL